MRMSTAELLERLQPADWLREGTHSESGPCGVETVAEDLCRARAQARAPDPRGTRCGTAESRERLIPINTGDIFAQPAERVSSSDHDAISWPTSPPSSIVVLKRSEP